MTTQGHVKRKILQTAIAPELNDAVCSGKARNSREGLLSHQNDGATSQWLVTHSPLDRQRHKVRAREAIKTKNSINNSPIRLETTKRNAFHFVRASKLLCGVNRYSIISWDERAFRPQKTHRWSMDFSFVLAGVALNGPRFFDAYSDNNSRLRNGREICTL